MTWYYAPGLMFSAYLRKEWNVSHFTVAQFLVVISSSISLLHSRHMFGAVVMIALSVFLIVLSERSAQLHNKPANVAAPMSPSGALLYISLSIFGFKLELVWILEVTTSFIMFYLLSIPGIKIDHDPKMELAIGAA